MSPDVSVLICDDDRSVGVALKEVIDTQPDLSVAAIALDGVEAVALAREHAPAVAIVDVRMPGGGGAQAARAIREHSPGTQIVAYSAHNDDEAIEEMKRAGASVYLVKGIPARDIVAAIRGVLPT